MWTDTRRENYCLVAIGALALITYTAVLLTHAVDMPKWDDYPDILQFLDRWLNAGSPQQKWDVFVSHTNEHILLVNHLVILAQYYVLGKVNFAGLIFIGNLFYLGSSLVLWWHFRTTAHSPYAFALLMLLGLTFYPHESTLWAMTALSNQAVIFFSLLAIGSAARTPASLKWVIPFTTLAIFSQSNGFFLLPTIAVLFYLRQRALLKTWLVFSIALIACYAILFDPASAQDGSASPSLLLNVPAVHWLLAPLAFIAGFGSFVFNTPGYLALALSVLAGTAILLLAWQNNRGLADDFILGVLLFLLLSLASISLYRGLVGGPVVVFISRYKMYALYFLAVAVLLSPGWLHHCHGSVRWRYGTLALALVIFGASFWLNVPAARLTNTHLRQSLEHWVEDGDLRRAKGYFIKDADSYLFAALHRGVWTPEVLLPEQRFLRNISSLPRCPETQPLAADDLLLKHINRNAPAICVDLANAEPPVEALLLCGSQHHYRVEWPPGAREGRHYLPAAAIAPDSYQVLVQRGGETRVSPAVLLRKPRTR